MSKFGEWTCVGDELPDFGQRVIAYHPSWDAECLNVDAIIYCPINNLTWSVEGAEVTHWMPLPETPLNRGDC